MSFNKATGNGHANNLTIKQSLTNRGPLTQAGPAKFSGSVDILGKLTYSELQQVHGNNGSISMSNMISSQGRYLLEHAPYNYINVLPFDAEIYSLVLIGDSAFMDGWVAGDIQINVVNSTRVHAIRADPSRRDQLTPDLLNSFVISHAARDHEWPLDGPSQSRILTREFDRPVEVKSGEVFFVVLCSGIMTELGEVRCTLFYRSD